MEKVDKWVEWARVQRDQLQRQLDDAQAGNFRVAEKDGVGKWNDVTNEHIARLASAIRSLNEILGEA